MSEVFAMQCCAEAARALMSEVLAQQSGAPASLYSYRYF